MQNNAREDSGFVISLLLTQLTPRKVEDIQSPPTPRDARVTSPFMVVIPLKSIQIFISTPYDLSARMSFLLYQSRAQNLNLVNFGSDLAEIYQIY